MQEVAHKCKLARNLNRLRELLPERYNFHPESFNLPVDFAAFEKAALGEGKGGKSNRTYIIKPDDGACGEGIFLTRRPSSVPPTLKCVAQVCQKAVARAAAPRAARVTPPPADRAAALHFAAAAARRQEIRHAPLRSCHVLHPPPRLSRQRGAPPPPPPALSL